MAEWKAPFVSPFQSTTSKTATKQQKVPLPNTPGRRRIPHISTHKGEWTGTHRGGAACSAHPTTSAAEPSAPEKPVIAGEAVHTMRFQPPGLSSPQINWAAAAVGPEMTPLQPLKHPYLHAPHPTCSSWALTPYNTRHSRGICATSTPPTHFLSPPTAAEPATQGIPDANDEPTIGAHHQVATP